MAYLNKCDLAEQYRTGSSIPDLAATYGIPRSAVRTYLLKSGVTLRSRAEGIRLAAHKISAATIGRKRGPMSDATKAKLRAVRLGSGRGFSVKRRGYIQITTGAQKGRHQHVVIMEGLLGRRLHPDEVVHHIDENTYNNSLSNLAIMTRSAHTSLHRRKLKKAA